MRTVTYRLDDLKDVVIHIGRAEENLATRVRIDAGKVFAEYPAAVPTMKVINPAGTVYGREVSRDGDLVIWDVTESDLAAEGQGEMQLTFTENSVIVKSADARTEVCRSISGGTTPPDPVQDWIDRAEEVLEEIEDAFPEGGTTGQVLAKKSDADFDTEWVDQGSGGTTDYAELTNKPQIAGVTLTGDKSLHDLGAAAESDIPDVSGFYTKPAGGIPASDIAEGVIPDPEDLIDDTAGAGDTDKTWSADKLTSDVLSAIDKLTPDATASDIGKALIVKTVADGKPSSYEYGEAGGGGAVIDDTAGAGDTDKVWSANKTVTEIQQIIVSGGVPIDDTAGTGDTDKIWSADKSEKSVVQLNNNIFKLNEGLVKLTANDFEQGADDQASNTRIRTKGFIPINKGGIVSCNSLGSMWYYVAKYDKDYSLIEKTGWNTTASDTVISQDCFIIVVCRDATSGSTQITPSDYDATITVKFGGASGSVKALVGENEQKNLFSDFDYSFGYLNNSGEVVSNDIQNITSDFIPIGDAKSITVQTWNEFLPSGVKQWRAICFFNANKEKIGSRYIDENQTTLYVSHTFSVYSGAVYCRVSSRVYGNYRVCVQLGETAVEYRPCENDINYLLYSCVANDQFIKSINHRGWNWAPENTLPAYVESFKRGFKYVETDVCMTSDGVPVLLHDETINRTARNADGTPIGSTVNIANITYEQALEYDFGIYKAQKYAGTKIPTLKQFLILCRNLGLHPYVELKQTVSFTQAQVNTIVDIAIETGMINNMTWLSFDMSHLNKVKTKRAKGNRFGLVSRDPVTSTIIDNLIALRANGDNEVFLDTNRYTGTNWENDYALIVAEDIPAEVWTVDSESDLVALPTYITGVTSNLLMARNVLQRNVLNNY